MKNAIIFILSFIVVAMGLCLCQPSENTNTNTIKKPEFNYNFNYTIPEYKEQNEQPTFNYDFPNDYEEDFNYNFSNYVYITKTGKCYHIGYCSHAKKSVGSMSRSQAIKKGYRACYYCCK